MGRCITFFFLCGLLSALPPSCHHGGRQREAELLQRILVDDEADQRIYLTAPWPRGKTQHTSLAHVSPPERRHQDSTAFPSSFPRPPPEHLLADAEPLPPRRSACPCRRTRLAAEHPPAPEPHAHGGAPDRARAPSCAPPEHLLAEAEPLPLRRSACPCLRRAPWRSTRPRQSPTPAAEHPTGPALLPALEDAPCGRAPTQRAHYDFSFQLF
ncbi:hypothetical protein BDA96_08G091500 [Sorghum bicolor]|uniref:Uncharacterized protein n=1 Tax=Sorghum bicolor TaxID=4558 RepID=A0A921QHL7_SORBI|nr:hypothetical protein BDA96_08G091500 [Sorghum bicolor]